MREGCEGTGSWCDSVSVCTYLMYSASWGTTHLHRGLGYHLFDAYSENMNIGEYATSFASRLIPSFYETKALFGTRRDKQVHGLRELYILCSFYKNSDN